MVRTWKTRKKEKRNERAICKPGAKGAPSASDFKAAAKTAKPVKKK
jgi:hypothetical protein